VLGGDGFICHFDISGGYCSVSLIFDNSDDWRSQAPIFFALFLFLFLAYMPAVQGDYLYGETYNLWTTKAGGKCDSFYAFKFYQRLGRPLLGWFICPSAFFIDSHQDANFVRFVGILFLAAMSYLFYLCLRYAAVKKIHAFLVALTLGTLPAYQLAVTSVVHQILLLAALISGFSFMAALKVARTIGEDFSIREQWSDIVYNRFSIASFILLMVSLLTYQQSAMMYWALAATILIRIDLHDWVVWRNRFLFLFGLGIFTMGIYFLYAKINFELMSLNVDINYDIKMFTSFSERVNWFMDVLTGAMSLWDINGNPLMVQFLLVLIILGAIVSLVQQSYIVTINFVINQNLRPLVEKLLILAALLPLSVFPAFVSGFEYTLIRLNIAIVVIVLVAAYWGVTKACCLLPRKRRHISVAVILGSVALFGVYKAHYASMNYISFPAGAETKFIKSAFRQNDLSKYDKLHVILLDSAQDSLIFEKDDQFVIHEFGFAMSWNSHNIHTMINFLLPDLSVVKRGWVKEIMKNNAFTAGHRNDERTIDEKTLLIDMTRITHFY